MRAKLLLPTYQQIFKVIFDTDVHVETPTYIYIIHLCLHYYSAFAEYTRFLAAQNMQTAEFPVIQYTKCT